MESIPVRCPECTKLYVVDRSEIRTEKPQFECIQCKTRFWFAFPPSADVKEVKALQVGDYAAQGQVGKSPEQPTKISQITQLPPSDATALAGGWRSIEEKANTFLCFKCGQANLKGSLECGSCGLVFEKARRPVGSIKETVVASKELRRLWDDVIQGYAQDAKHEAFIKMALAQKNLPYASQQYRLILEANPNDDMAIKMRDKIINIATLTYVPPKRMEPPKKRIPYPMIVAGLGFLIVLLGLSVKPLRDTIPIGAVFSTVGLLTMVVRRLQN